MLAQVSGPASKTYIYMCFQSFFMKIRVSLAGPYQDLILGSQDDRFWSHFGVILESFWGSFGLEIGAILDK